jgi:tetratricopeptide (TPR) repeat protein
MGRVYFSVGQALSATDEYSLIAEKGVDSIQAREFAVALFKAGLLPAAYERSKALREAVADVIPGITEIETDYLVRLGKMEKAKDLLKKLSQKRPLSVLNRMAIVRICASLGQEEEARAELEKVQHLKLTPEMREEVEQFAADLDVVLTIKERSAGH